jgi:NTE family protein
MVVDDLQARAEGAPLSKAGDVLVRRAGGWPSFAAALAAQEQGHEGAKLPLPPSAPGLLGELLRHPGRIRPGLLAAACLPVGTVDPAPITAVFDRLLGPGWPAEDLWVCAADLDSGQRNVFGLPGTPPVSVGTAVAASSSVPSVFAPVVVDGRRYVDGGVHSPANTDVLTAQVHELTAVVVSVPMGIGANPRRIGVDLPGRLLNHLDAWRGLDAVRRAGVPLLVLEPGATELEVMGYDSFDSSHRAEIATRARTAVAGRLVGGHAGIEAIRGALDLR